MQLKQQPMAESFNTPLQDIQLKAELLSHGIQLTPELYTNFGPPFLEKRRAYGNQDPLEIRVKTIPQELYLTTHNLVSAINVRPCSPWLLSYEDEKFVIKSDQTKNIEVTFPLRPHFYEKTLSSGQKVNQFITLYGGKSLALFVYGTCSLVIMKKPCHYCSIDPNRSKPTDFENVIKPTQLEEALELALADCPAEINQVMLNGGNFPDLDKSFTYYAELVRVASKVLSKHGKHVELHLIVFPPKNLELLKLLKGTGVSVAMNTEIFDAQLFEKYCPGKVAIGGQKHMFSALKEAVNVLGEGKVYSILVGGLEPHESLVKGLQFLEDLGVTPVINVFHSDPDTPLAHHPTPTADYILKMGRALQDIYSRNLYMKPFYSDCGRNSLDSEAYRNLFH